MSTTRSDATATGATWLLRGLLALVGLALVVLVQAVLSAPRAHAAEPSSSDVVADQAAATGGAPTGLAGVVPALVEDVVAPVAHPVVESVVAPVVQPVVERVVAPVAQPVAERVAAPVAQPVVERVV
ncbi:hypothetical protein HGA02_07725, partial [Cellulomonas septica]|nr:hypothetical protein [Cellulomonas septica]